MKNPYKIFHSPCAQLRKAIHVVLVRPEQGANVGAAARAMANMGIEGSFRIVGEPTIIDSSCLRLAKHAKSRIDQIQFFSSLAEALPIAPTRKLSMAATARIGSPNRPHPVRVRTAMERSFEKLREGEIVDIFWVFGPESCGLTNEEIDRCDWVVTIPSSDEYRSLNLAQSVLIFSHEMNSLFLENWENFQSHKPSQRAKLIQHLIQLAEDVGFVLPGDPYKMRSRLEDILSQLPNHIPDIKTIHGLLDQVRRSVHKGAPDIRGRYLHKMTNHEEEKHVE